MIGSIFLLFVHDSPSFHKSLPALRLVSISNDLHFSDTMSSFEIAKSNTKPLLDYVATESVSDELVQSRAIIISKVKINPRKRSKAITDPEIEPGNSMQVYMKKCPQKWGKWSSPRILNIVNKWTGTVCAPGSNGESIITSLEDTRFAKVEVEFASHVLKFIDQIEDGMEDVFIFPSDYTTDRALDDFGTPQHSPELNASFDDIKYDTSNISAVAPVIQHLMMQPSELQHPIYHIMLVLTWYMSQILVLKPLKMVGHIL